MSATPELPCLLCERTFPHADQVRSHMGKDHHPSLRYAVDIYGTRCPACGQEFKRLDQHSKTHGRQVALLFADARRDGDPYGVVQAQINHALELMLSDVEERVTRLG